MSVKAIPGILVVGPQAEAREYARRYAQKVLCSAGGCQTCLTCQKITTGQHHLVRWIKPEKTTYTLDQISRIRHELSFALDEHDSFFFIVDAADYLSPACANSLLKSLEEPPRGYHFILCAERRALVLPTIVSRCVVHEVGGVFVGPCQELVNMFSSSRTMPLHQFALEFDRLAVTEQQAASILDALIQAWRQAYAQSLDREDQDLARRAVCLLELFGHAYQRLPMPGGSKLFWRSLYLAYVQIQKP